jgi:hypothetical protein
MDGVKFPQLDGMVGKRLGGVHGVLARLLEIWIFVDSGQA